MSKLTKSILATIEKKKLTPHTKAWFQTKNSLVWGLVVLTIILAGVLLAGLIRELLEAEWEIASRYPGGSFRFIREAVSFLWLAGILSAFAMSFVFFRQTKRGYRYGVFGLGGVLIVASLALASSLIPTDIPGDLRDFREKQLGIPPFDEAQWLNPEEGFLIGKIQQSQNALLILNTLDKSLWEVGIGDAKIAPMMRLVIGEEIRAMGEKTGENSFEAEIVMPCHPRHRMMFFQRENFLDNNPERNSKLPAYHMMQAR
jgi:hypothetical protein